jgi:hypothetical protein
MTIHKGVPARAGITLSVFINASNIVSGMVILSENNNLKTVFEGPFWEAWDRTEQISLTRFNGDYDTRSNDVAALGNAMNEVRALHSRFITVKAEQNPLSNRRRFGSILGAPWAFPGSMSIAAAAARRCRRWHCTASSKVSTQQCTHLTQLRRFGAFWIPM